MPDPEAVAEVALAWLARADVDLGTARTLLANRKEVAAWVASFHAQQAAEKYLKAALVAEQVPFSRTHELERLASTLSTPWGLPEAAKLAGLTRYAIAGRYPEDLSDSGTEPTWPDAEEAVRLADAIRRCVVDGFTARGMSSRADDEPGGAAAPEG